MDGLLMHLPNVEKQDGSDRSMATKCGSGHLNNLTSIYDTVFVMKLDQPTLWPMC